MKEFMKPMIYTAERKQPEQIAAGTYKGLDYYVLSLGTHPCGYVNVVGTKLYGKDYDDIDIECHGGLTYANKSLRTVNDTGWFIGFDYAHYGDYMGYDSLYSFDLTSDDKRWTTEEIVEECKNVIEQIIRLENEI